MAANEYYKGSQGGDFSYQPYQSRTDSPPTLPPLRIQQQHTAYAPLTQDRPNESPSSPSFNHPNLHHTRTSGSDESDSQYYGGRGGRRTDSNQYSENIRLKDHPQSIAGYDAPHDHRMSPDDDLPSPAAAHPRKKRRREPEKKGFSVWTFPWICWTFALVHIVVFIAELIRNAQLTSSPIQIHPQINPLIGPSYYVLINMGGRYLPCMKDISYLNLPANIRWPCANATSGDVNNPDMQCKLDDLCGFAPLSNPPNQWFRFIVPIFLHGGLIHIGFNLLLQLTLAREMEKTIGSLRFLLVYMASGIFGFIMGGNFAASGIVAIGASGSLFGIIAINLLDLLYKWNERRSPWKELIFIILDIVIAFVLGLLPGFDNFSHIGGFLMGLVLGVCILRSPNKLQDRISSDPLAGPVTTRKSRSSKEAAGLKGFAKEPVGFFRGRKLLWWAWWLVRAGALLGILVCFIVLLNNFYKYNETCSWCKYLSCLNVSNWCDVGNLPSQVKNSSNAKRELWGPSPVDISAFL